MVLSCSSHDPANYCQDVALRQIHATPSKPFAGADPLRDAYNALSKRKNAILPIALLRKHSDIWKAFLPNVADYLWPGRGVWWHSNKHDIIFHDCDGVAKPSPPVLEHFRNITRREIETRVNDDWVWCTTTMLEKDWPPPRD